MTTTPLIKIRVVTAAEVCANFPVEDQAKEILRGEMSPGEFVAALVEKKRFSDAIDFLAHALPVREGIWWGCLCMQHALGDNLEPPDRAAATAAVQWLMQPVEEHRAAAKAQGMATGPLSSAGALAKAVGLTGGSLHPPELPFKPPPPFAPQAAVGRAVKLASIKADPPLIPKIQRSYVDLAMQIAEGRLS
jgi:hypothetical protein